MTTFETLRIDMYKLLIELDDDNHPLWDIWGAIKKAEIHMHKLEQVVEVARKLKPKQPSEVKIGEYLVEGWPELIIALRELDGEK